MKERITDTLGGKIKQARRAAKLTQSALGDKIGKAASTVQKYELDLTQPPYTIIVKIAEACGIKIEQLLGWNRPVDDLDKEVLKIYPDFVPSEHYIPTQPLPEPLPDNISPLTTRRVPLLGDIAAGVPIYADEQHDMYVPVGLDIRCDFALRVKGDSMSPLYLDGDIVYVRKQDSVDDGATAAVLIGDEATLKNVHRIPQGVTLIPNNPKYQPIVLMGEDCDSLRILGRAVAYLRRV